MTKSLSAPKTRIEAMLLRYFYLHTRSLPRTLEVFFWPVMEILVWGFVSLYLKEVSQNSLAYVAKALLSAMIFWDILYRSQQAISIAVVEDIWTQNIINILVSPLRLSEWLIATIIYGTLKTFVIAFILCLIAAWGYHLSWETTQLMTLSLLVVSLLFFGWSIGIFTAGLVIRWGHAAEALIWGIPFLIQPLSAVFYPVSVMPGVIQWVSYLLPSTYVFEGLRQFSSGYPVSIHMLTKAWCLNILWLGLSSLSFWMTFDSARKSGRLSRLGMD